MRLHRLLLLAAAVAAGCDSGPTSVSDGTVTAQRRNVVLDVANASSQPVHYLVIEREAAAYTDWIVCTGPACPSIAGGSSLQLPVSQVIGIEEGSREALLYWWRSVSDGNGGFTHDSIRVLIVPL